MLTVGADRRAISAALLACLNVADDRGGCFTEPQRYAIPFKFSMGSFFLIGTPHFSCFLAMQGSVKGRLDT